MSEVVRSNTNNIPFNLINIQSNDSPKQTYQDLVSLWNQLDSIVQSGGTLPDALYSKIQSDINALENDVPGQVNKELINSFLGEFYAIATDLQEGNIESARQVFGATSELLTFIGDNFNWN